MEQNDDGLAVHIIANEVPVNNQLYPPEEPIPVTTPPPEELSKDIILEHNKLSYLTFFYFYYPLIYQNFICAIVLFILYYYFAYIRIKEVFLVIPGGVSFLILLIIVIILKSCYKKEDIIKPIPCCIMHLLITVSLPFSIITVVFIFDNKIPFFIIFSNLTIITLFTSIITYFATVHYFLFSILILIIGLPCSAIWFIYSQSDEYMIAIAISFLFVIFYISFSSYLYNHVKVSDRDDQYMHKMNMKYYSAMLSTITLLWIIFIIPVIVVLLVAMVGNCEHGGDINCNGSFCDICDCYPTK